LLKGGGLFQVDEVDEADEWLDGDGFMNLSLSSLEENTRERIRNPAAEGWQVQT
jgi:hypothetical protein